MSVILMRKTGGHRRFSPPVFIVSVVPHDSGIVREYFKVDTDPTDKVIDYIESDTSYVDVTIECDGPDSSWQPTVNVNGISVTLTRLAGDVRRFSGIIENIDVSGGLITAISSTGSSHQIPVTIMGPGPDVLTLVIGPYPGIQTELKENDIVSVSGTVNVTSGFIKLNNFGIFKESGWVAITDEGTHGSFIFDGTVSNRNGVFTAQVIAKNDFGTPGDPFESTETRILNQTVPSFIFGGITYPDTQGAIKNSENAVVDLQVIDFNNVVYDSPNSQINVVNPIDYNRYKTAVRIDGNYNDSVNNFRCIAYRQQNGTSADFECIIEIAHIAPTINVSEEFARLRTSPTGEDYSIFITSNQKLKTAPLLSNPINAGDLGSFSGGEYIWVANINVDDTDIKGIHTWTNLVCYNKANILQNIITGDNTYEIGGFLQRILTVAAWPNREASIGTIIRDTSKLRCTNLSKGQTGTLNFTYKNTIINEVDKYTITSPSGVANPNGNIWYNCDLNNAVSNTSGTMLIELEEIV